MRKELTIADLEAETAELLPSRETLNFNTNLANVVASNSSMALNAASYFSHANSTAFQTVSVSQG
jgi:hypothetical protein